MKKQIIFCMTVIWAITLTSCGGEQSAQQSAQTVSTTPTASDDEKGIGPIKEVTIGALDQTMANAGKEIYDLKCMACHHLDNTKLVGPGWKDVTKRRKPEWIMNFTINPEDMLNKDAKAMTLLEECLVRMPNQNLSETDARNVFEFMRRNDGDK